MTTPAQIEALLKAQQAGPAMQRKGSLPFQFSLVRHVRRRDVSDFTRQLATMIRARLPLTRCLEILEGQQKKSRFKSVIRDILDQVKSGKSLTESMKSWPNVFNPFYRNMVHVGELSGDMTVILDQLALYLEKMTALRRKFLTALSYPAVIVVVAAGALSFLILGVMPSFTEMFRDFEVAMPLPTQILIHASEFLKTWFVLITAVFMAAVALFRWYITTEKGRQRYDRWKMRIPLTGRIVRQVMIARFLRTLGTLLQSGVALLDALDVTSESAGNVHLAHQVAGMKNAAAKGEALEASLQNNTLFPDLVVQMIAVGEETAELPRMLLQTAEYYEMEVDASIDALTSVIEPVIIVFLGVVIGGAVVAIYLQIFELMNVIQ